MIKENIDSKKFYHNKLFINVTHIDILYKYLTIIKILCSVFKLFKLPIY